MSFALDVNILLYASDEESQRYEAARQFLDSSMEGPELVYIAWTTVMAYLRMATHPSIFQRPLHPDEAMSNVDSLIQLPHVILLSERDGFWETYRVVARQVLTRGNLVPDTHLAALLLQHGITLLYTCDRDFRKFDFLMVKDPLS